MNTKSATKKNKSYYRKTIKKTEKDYKAHVTKVFIELLNMIKLYHWKTRSYAQTTRFELGEWYGKGMDNFVVGVQPGFHGERYIKYKFEQDDYKVETNIKDVTKNIIKKIKDLLD